MELYYKLRNHETHVVDKWPDGRAIGFQPIALIKAMSIIGNFVYECTKKPGEGDDEALY